MRSNPSRTLVGSLVALTLLLGGLLWIAPRAVSERFETRSALAAGAEHSRTAPVTMPFVLEAEPEIARAPAAPPVDARGDSEPNSAIEPARDELVAQREVLLRELADVTARIERLDESIAARDEEIAHSPTDVSSARIGFLLPAPEGAGDLTLGAARFDPIVERSLDQVRRDLARYLSDLETRIDARDSDSGSSGFGFGCRF